MSLIIAIQIGAAHVECRPVGQADLNVQRRSCAHCRWRRNRICLDCHEGRLRWHLDDVAARRRGAALLTLMLPQPVAQHVGIDAARPCDLRQRQARLPACLYQLASGLRVLGAATVALVPHQPLGDRFGFVCQRGDDLQGLPDRLHSPKRAARHSTRRLTGGLGTVEDGAVPPVESGCG